MVIRPFLRAHSPPVELLLYLRFLVFWLLAGGLSAPFAQAQDSTQLEPGPNSTSVSQASAPLGYVERAQFTSLVDNREPADQLLSTTADIGKLFFFTEIREMTGKTLVHQWRYDDQVVAEVSFDVKGSRWRVFSYKTMQASLTGEWTVSLIDSDGYSRGEYSILVSAPTGVAEPEPLPPTQPVSQPAVPASIPQMNISRIQTVFPNSNYRLVNDTLSTDVCPPSGNFSWKKLTDRHWGLDMAGNTYVRVQESQFDSVGLTPDPSYKIAGSNCLMYSGHQFNMASSELVTELQTDCEGEAADIFSAVSLVRRESSVDLTIFGDELSVCRYQLN